MLLALSFNCNAQLNYLFSATTRPYVPVTGGITPPLITDYTAWEARDEGFGRVPIGFTFKYDGENYTHANVDVNGFITLKDSLNVFYNYPYFQNHLASAPPYDKRPVIAAFWDDLLLADTLDLVYKTTGHAPFRVFTVEWKKAKWVYESLAPVLSIELELYETTNIIEFHYKDEGSLPDPRYAFASIGISSSYANRGFISLQSTSPHPDISMLRANDSLTIKPADNQVYRFIPSVIKIPSPIENSIRYTDNSVSFNLASGGFNGYEYALTHSPIPPSSGIKTFNPNVTISSLMPATTYYIYARSKWFGWFNSQWTCDSFTTAVNPVDPPYFANVNGATYPPWIPIDMRQQDFEDTSYWYDPSLGWFGFSDFPNAGDIGFGYYHVDFYDANAWLFSPGIKLIGGKTYQLKFGYLSFFEFNPGDPSSLEVKYGRANGVAAMKSGTLFKKTDITNSDAAIDTAIEFTPDRSGAYYFGFHDMSLFLQGWLVVSNISVTEKPSSIQTPYVLAGKTNSTDNILNWTSKNNKISKGFEVQRSTDGVHFTKIDNIAGQTMPSKTHSTFRMHKNTESSTVANITDKHSKVFDANKPLAELQRSDDGINFKKVSDPAPKRTDKADAKVKYDYTDHNAEGLNYYRVKETDKKGAISYSNIVILNNNTLSPGLKAYPNPAKDVLNVELPIGVNKVMTLLVTDVSGKTILSKAVQSIKGGNLVQLDISHLTPGMYLLKLTCPSGCENAVMKFEKK